MKQFSRLNSFIVILALLAALGCGKSGHPPMGRVAGIVTYEGKPVPNINVLMAPEKARTAMATTDKNGRFDMEYMSGEKGTKIGPNIVSLEWPLGTDPPFFLAEKYSAIKSTIKLDVQKGKNKDFNIEIEPDPEGAKKAAAKPKFIVD